VASLHLECMLEAQASGASLWGQAWANHSARGLLLSIPPSFALIIIISIWSSCNIHIHTYI
jgi:hypothetical protein